MIIAGLDMSKVHYALSVTDGENTDFTFTTATQSIAKLAQQKEYNAHLFTTWLLFQKEYDCNCAFAYTAFAAERMKAFLVSDFVYMGTQMGKEEKYIAMEGYALGAETGQLTQIAEVSGVVKSFLYNCGWKIRIHDPQSVKMFATGNGHAQKAEMVAASKLYGLSYPSFLEGRTEQEDIADSFFLMKMMETELKVRKNPKVMESLPEHHRHIFNRVTKGNPVNILVQNFIDIERIPTHDSKH